MKPFDIFVACLPGLEELLASEIAELGLGNTAIRPGGVSLAGHRRSIYRANLELGLATRVTIPIGHFRARSFPELLRKTAALDWHAFLHPGKPFDVRATCRKSQLYHSSGVEERVALGVLEKLQEGPELSAEEEEASWPTVRVRVTQNECRIALDTTGVPLYQRGYKTDVGKAPLRDDVARALVIASGWDRESPLVDPLCGCGTIPIEAATLARRLAPGRLREFAFQRTPLFDESTWLEVQSAASRRVEDCRAAIHGSDRDEGIVAAATQNVERAALTDAVTVTHAALSDAAFLCGEPPAPERGALVTNPPWGQRVGTRDLRTLYQALGNLARKLPPAWRVAIAASSRRLALKTGLALETAFLTDHGGVKVRAMVGQSACSPS